MNKVTELREAFAAIAKVKPNEMPLYEFEQKDLDACEKVFDNSNCSDKWKKHFSEVLKDKLVESKNYKFTIQLFLAFECLNDAVKSLDIELIMDNVEECINELYESTHHKK